MTAVERQLVAGRFRIVREVGRGAAGIVYRALDVSLDQPAALKVLSGTADDEEGARFLREGEVLSALAHRNIVRVVAYGSLESSYSDAAGLRFAPGTPYVAMEWLEGEDVAVRQRRSPMPLALVVEVARQVSEALAFAHDAGVVHRDIKPSNIFLTSPTALAHDEDAPDSRNTLRPTAAPGSPFFGDEPTIAAGTAPEPYAFDILAKILDFGVASSRDAALSGAGAIVGTPAYMSPEQAQGDAIPDARSDLYSLGATLFELCAGRPPHAAPTSIATLARRVTGPAPRLSEILLDVPEKLDELVARLLELEPKDRPRSGREVATLLAEIALDPTVRREHRLTLREEDSRARIGTRLVTTVVALGVATGEERQRTLARVRSFGADALPLGTDSIVAHLGARQAFGDEAARAIDIGTELAARGAKVGIATGRTRVDLTQSSGDIVDRAAKLAREAADGKIVHDLTTGDLTRGRLELDVPSIGESGLFTTKTRRRADSDASSFVGRETELATVLAAYDRCESGHAPVVVSVSGPPGIGKSRLGQEILVRLERREEPPRAMVVRCESYARAQALGTASDLLRSLLLLPKGATLAEARSAIRAISTRDGDEHALLAHLLSNQPFPEGIEPRAARDALYVSMTELVLHAAEREPTAVVIEDAQWADPESIAWVDHLLGRAEGKALFSLLLVRPTFWRTNQER
ncbi:MAG TPA: serine/threonine-protein kinase, partial [Polyangiaceae bacterium]|nr:serine/threonine-protein kinase [Polyangiaceae bacterium]